MKVLAILFPGYTSKIKLYTDLEPDFKSFPFDPSYPTNGYRRRSSAWHIIVKEEHKDEIQELANKFNANCDKLKDIWNENQEIKKRLKELSNEEI